MAESDTILQLGIEAAREGNREEARNLFTLLTRQEPDNVQAWLWLAGVADGPDQRRAALERVLELEPDNEMAIKGLQAMGVTPAVPASFAASEPTVVEEPARSMTDEERYAAELDSAFDDYDSVPRATPRSEPLEAEVGATSAGEERAAARERAAERRARMADKDAAAARGGQSPLLWALLGLIALAILIFFGSRLLDGGRQTAGGGQPRGAATTAAGPSGALDTTAAPEAMGATAEPGAAGVSGPEGATAEPGAAPAPEGATAEPGAAPAPEGATAEPGAAPAPEGATAVPEAPPAQPPAAQPPASDLARANPALIPDATLLSASGWSYRPYAEYSYAAVLGPQQGSFTAKGTYVLVLMLVANNTGTDQPLPPDFFVLKDAQGNVYNALPQVSTAYFSPGSADRTMEDAVPANGVLTSVPLIFDVQRGATNLVLFTRGKTDQGWQVLNAAP